MVIRYSVAVWPSTVLVFPVFSTLMSKSRLVSPLFIRVCISLRFASFPRRWLPLGLFRVVDIGHGPSIQISDVAGEGTNPGHLIPLQIDGKVWSWKAWPKDRLFYPSARWPCHAPSQPRCRPRSEPSVSSWHPPIKAAAAAKMARIADCIVSPQNLSVRKAERLRSRRWSFKTTLCCGCDDHSAYWTSAYS